MLNVSGINDNCIKMRQHVHIVCINEAPVCMASFIASINLNYKLVSADYSIIIRALISIQVQGSP